MPGFKASEQPVLATGKVRQVGELIAMCVAPTRAEAEDIAAAVTLDLEELPAVHDMLMARKPGSALVHEHWGDNIFLERSTTGASFATYGLHDVVEVWSGATMTRTRVLPTGHGSIAQLRFVDDSDDFITVGHDGRMPPSRTAIAGVGLMRRPRPQQVALAHDADQATLCVDDRRGGDGVAGQQCRRLVNRVIRTDGQHGPGHHIRRSHRRHRLPDPRPRRAPCGPQHS